jgi:hypothetical protein
MLRGKHPETGEYNDNDFFDLASLNSFALGCAKKLAKKQDEHSTTLLELFNEKERLSQEIADLRLQLQTITSQEGANA